MALFYGATSNQVKKTGQTSILIELKVAPRDIARLCALLEGHDGLGAPRTISAHEGHLALEVPTSMLAEAESALRAIETHIPMRRLDSER